MQRFEHKEITRPANGTFTDPILVKNLADITFQFFVTGGGALTGTYEIYGSMVQDGEYQIIGSAVTTKSFVTIAPCVAYLKLKTTVDGNAEIIMSGRNQIVS